MALTIGSGRRRQGLWLGLLIGPSAAGWIIWKIYLHVARIRPDLTFRPVATWDWWAPVTVLRALFINRLRDHPGIGGTALSIALAVICLCPVLWRRLPREGTLRLVPPRALLAIIAVVCGCFAAFLAAAYMGFFSPEEVAQAGSIWRYLTELGPLLLAGAAAVVGALAPPWRMPARNALAGVVGTLTVMATLALPVIACGHYALDCRYPDVIASRLVTAELARPLADFAPNAGKQRRLAIIHPTMGDWMAHAAAYDLGWPVISRSIRYRTNGDGRSAQQWAWDVGADALLDLTALDRSTLTETGIIPSVALRARPPGRDAPWTTVAATVPRPLPRCGGR